MRGTLVEEECTDILKVIYKAALKVKALMNLLANENSSEQSMVRLQVVLSQKVNKITCIIEKQQDQSKINLGYQRNWLYMT